MSERKKLEADKRKAFAMMEATPPDFEGLRIMLEDTSLDEALVNDIQNFLDRNGERIRPNKRGAEDGNQGTDEQRTQEKQKDMTQDEKDEDDIKRALGNNSLTKLKEIEKRPLSEANRRRVNDAIAMLEAAIAKNVPGGGDKPSVTDPTEQPLFLSRVEGFSGGGESIGSGVTGPLQSKNVPSRFFPYFVKDDEVARYADGVNQVTNLRKIRK